MDGFDRYGCGISVPTCGNRKEIEKMTLGKKIYTLRSAAQISQEALAERLDVSRQSVSKWEIDQAVPQIDKVLLLSELFSVSCDSLLRDDIDIYGDKPGERSSINEPSGGNKYFGTDGFRGEANITLTSEQAYKVGRFLGWYYSSPLSGFHEPAYRPRIVIGKDTRRSSYMFEYSLVAGLTASGADAYMLHVTTTPSVSYVTRQDRFDCGIMITASHNPYYDNGIKIVSSYGEKLDDGTVKSTLANGEELISDEVLVAIGRTLNTRGMGLEEVGVKMEKNGQIVTDEHMRTSVPNIFAAGDITVGTQLSDKAQRQGLVIAETIAGGDYYINYDAIPATMFMEPEIAMVGLTVSDAAERGIETISGSLPFSSNEKAMAIGKTEGLIKVVARKDDHVIIGAQIFGHEACDLIAEMTVAVENGLTLEQVYNSIHPHPTVTEIILEVCKRAVGLSFDK